MPEYQKIFETVIPLFVLIAVGAVVRVRGVLNEKADRSLLDLVVHLLLPCLILDHLVANQALRDAGNLLWSPVLGFGCAAAGVGIAALAARLWKFPHAAQARTFAFTAGICNYGYIPVPLIAVLYGANALAVLFLFNLGTEAAFWTVGFSVLEGRRPFRDWGRALTSPVRAILLGVTINLLTARLGFTLDEATLDAVPWAAPVSWLLGAIHLIGLCAIPLPLLLIGATMADFWKIFRGHWGIGVMGLSFLVRNLICPAGYVLLAWLLPVSQELRETLIVQAAMPAGIFSLVLARHHGGDVPVALQVIFGTSTAALITLPLWIHFGTELVGGK
jgi:malate permease and related proteins